MSKIQKTIARQQERIAEGQYYEAHQQLRVVASRYIKQLNWDAALNVLAEGAISLLKANQGGSGGDLSIYFVETLDSAGRQPTPVEKGKILTILRAFPREEPTRKRFIDDAITWTAKYGEYETGDSDLHHVAGSLYAEECKPYEAERHLAVGTKDSPETLARLQYAWYTQADSHTAASFAARAVFPYLVNRNVRSANKAYLIFISQLGISNRALTVQDVSSSTCDIRVYPSLPLLNFIGLLLLAIQRGGGDVFHILTNHYAMHIQELDMWDSALAQIGELYFGIQIPKQGNPLFDMMGSMLFGGGGGSSAATRGRTRNIDATMPPTVDLD